MRTVKHKLKSLSVATEQKTKFLDVVYAYQFEKNYFSDQLLSHNNEVINLQSSYIQIRDKLVKNNYQSQYSLPARLWKMALKEAYDLHIRTHESQIALIKRNLNNNIYQYCNFEFIKQNQTNKTYWYNQDAKTNHLDKKEFDNEFVVIHSFEKFLYFATNSLFYNFKTFCRFEAEYFSKQFKKARIYQRAKTILLDLLKRGKVVEKEVLTKEEAKQLKQLLESNSDKLFNRLFEHYCHSLVKVIQKFRSFKPIQSQINPTITLDGDCYDLYSKYDDEAKKNRWFLDIMSMESGKRIKGLELTGFNHAKEIMKHRKAANLTISFEPTGEAYAHFTFPIRKSVARKNKKSKQNKKQQCKTKKFRSHASKLSTSKGIGVAKLETLTTIGGDFGLTECFTFSDGWVAGRTQRNILKTIADKTKDDIARIQSNSQKKYFGLEKNNPTNKRNHTNNCFNHNSDLNNINTNYRKRQKRYNSYLENYKHQIVSDIINHFTTDNEFGNFGNFGNYGSYKAYENSNGSNAKELTLVFEDLTYINLGRTKDDKRQINLIKGVLTLLEEKVELYNLPIKIKYVNPAYTSQTCPNCYYVDRKNRNSQYGKFRCQHCGFTANDDERYQGLTKCEAIFREYLPSEYDFIAACNIANRLSVLPNSMKLRQGKIKDLLLEMHRHKQVKGSCKMFTCEH